jgi:hypothetical protein
MICNWKLETGNWKIEIGNWRFANISENLRDQREKKFPAENAE